MKMKKARVRLLLELESIIGGECYNANIQNWGPNGTFFGEGREFRYPITFLDAERRKDKKWLTDKSMSPDVAITGYYAFGANQLSIIRALDKVVTHLERGYGLQIGAKPPKRKSAGNKNIAESG